jgi:hypothetical protein
LKVDESVKSIEVPLSSLRDAVGGEIPKWKRPIEGWIKLNSNGALNVVDNMAGTGVIARDHSGNFVLVECRRYEYIVDPGMVELLACRDAVFLARTKG